MIKLREDGNGSSDIVKGSPGGAAEWGKRWGASEQAM